MAGAPHAALQFSVSGFISITRTIACGVTDMVVGSGALFGVFSSDAQTSSRSPCSTNDLHKNVALLPQAPARGNRIGRRRRAANALHFVLRDRRAEDTTLCK